jgi:ATP-binding cassette, subfamily C (CFTR/MRP), member 1
MIDQTGGSILIDSVDIATVPHEHLRSRLVGVPQESYIFDGTLRVNVDPSGEVADEDITNALKQVQLWDKVEQRGGLDTVISDKFFSQGEAQLLMFARAMLRKSKVLILDEISSRQARLLSTQPKKLGVSQTLISNLFSSLDKEASDIIDKVLRSWFKDWTVIAIAHKLDSILDYDGVAVLDDGTLIEYGVPRKLLEQDSSFRKLYEAATQGSEDNSSEENTDES